MRYVGGVMAKAVHANGSYVEGSLRIDRVRSDYAGNVAGTDMGDNASTYYTGHIGAGQEWQCAGGF